MSYRAARKCLGHVIADQYGEMSDARPALTLSRMMRPHTLCHALLGRGYTWNKTVEKRSATFCVFTSDRYRWRCYILGILPNFDWWRGSSSRSWIGWVWRSRDQDEGRYKVIYVKLHIMNVLVSRSNLNTYYTMMRGWHRLFASRRLWNQVQGHYKVKNLSAFCGGVVMEMFCFTFNRGSNLELYILTSWNPCLMFECRGKSPEFVIEDEMVRLDSISL